MTGNGAFLAAVEDGAYGTREWLTDMEDGGAASGCIAADAAWLPELDIALLVDPLRDSGFSVPAAAPDGASPLSRVPTRGETPASQRNISPPTPVISSAAQILTLLQDMPRAAAAGNSRSAADYGHRLPFDSERTAPAGLSRSPNVQPHREPASMADVSRGPVDGLREGAARTESVPASGPSGAGLTRTLKPALPAAALLRSGAIHEMYGTLLRETERRLTEWTRGPAGIVYPFADPAAADWSEVLAAAGSRPAAAVSSAESPQPAEQAPELAVTIDRLVETLTLIDNRLRAHPAPAPPTGAVETSPGEIQWHEDDDLAGRLHAILNRQARRRGIDLS